MNDIARFPDLHGASVFITGGGSGIGASLTDGFLEQGAKVAFVQRSDASEFVAEMLEKHGQAPLFIPCDITDNDAMKAAVSPRHERSGRRCDRELHLDQLYDGQRRLSSLCHSQRRHHRNDPCLGARIWPQQHPCQRIGPRLGADAKAKRLVGDRRRSGRASGTAMPERHVRTGRHRWRRSVSGIQNVKDDDRASHGN